MSSLSQVLTIYSLLKLVYFFVFLPASQEVLQIFIHFFYCLNLALRQNEHWIIFIELQLCNPFEEFIIIHFTIYVGSTSLITLMIVTYLLFSCFLIMAHFLNFVYWINQVYLLCHQLLSIQMAKKYLIFYYFMIISYFLDSIMVKMNHSHFQMNQKNLIIVYCFYSAFIFSYLHSNHF